MSRRSRTAAPPVPAQTGTAPPTQVVRYRITANGRRFHELRDLLRTSNLLFGATPNIATRATITLVADAALRQHHRQLIRLGTFPDGVPNGIAV